MGVVVAEDGGRVVVGDGQQGEEELGLGDDGLIGELELTRGERCTVSSGVMENMLLSCWNVTAPCSLSVLKRIASTSQQRV